MLQSSHPQTSSSRYFVIVPAAGIGSRMQDAQNRPKQYLTLQGKSILEITLSKLLSLDWLDAVCVALHPDDTYWQALPEALRDRVITVTGGETRAESVQAALLALDAQANDWALVHDAARACVAPEAITLLRDTVLAQVASSEKVGGILAAPVTDTIKRKCDHDGVSPAPETVDRSMLWKAQTPQMFPYQLLIDALAASMAVTDEASAIEQAGHDYALVLASQQNIKITYPEDMLIAEAILRAQRVLS